MTTVLLQIIGLLLIIVSVGVITNLSYYQKLFSQTDLSHGFGYVLYMSGIINILLGLTLLLNTETTLGIGETLIMIVGYMAMIKGILAIFFPKSAIQRMKFKLGSQTSMIVFSVFGLILGLLMVYVSKF